MVRDLVLCCVAICSILAGACNRPPIEPQKAVAEHYVSDPDSVGFDIEPLQPGNDVSQWLATYTARGKTAKFRIELGSAKALDDQESKEFDLASGEGRFVAEQGSDASALLEDLQKALGRRAFRRRFDE
jgi:hypothetical protein